MGAPYYAKGTANALCDVCGFKFKLNQLRKRWDSLMVCPEDFEDRHPQDFVRGLRERTALRDLRPEPPDEFIEPEEPSPPVENAVVQIVGANQGGGNFPNFSYFSSSPWSVQFRFTRDGGNAACTASWSIRTNPDVTVTSDLSGELSWDEDDFDLKSITVSGTGSVPAAFNPSFYVDLVAGTNCTVGGETADAPFSDPTESIPAGTAYGAMSGF